jgi:hypothetical protein
MKLRLFLTSALFLFTQISTMQAQETVDVTKITCDELASEQLTLPSSDVWLWLSGYYNGKRNNTVIDIQAIKKDKDKVILYCYDHRDAPVLDAMKNVIGLDGPMLRSFATSDASDARRAL